MSEKSPSNSAVGLGFRPIHYKQVVEEKPEVGWFEIISENFLNLGGRPRVFLEKLRETYPIACHGVGLNIASLDPLNEVYLKKLKTLVDAFEPFLVTDHLCWTSYEGKNSHDLLPFAYTHESLAHVAERISCVQDFLGRSILLENPSAYVSFHSEFSEAEFLSLLAKKTGCEILLDINNLFVNSCNLNLNPVDYLETLSLDAVKQFHLAGHTIRPDVRIDTHDKEIDDRVWDLFSLAVQKWPNAYPLIEWDDNIPSLNVLKSLASKAEKIHHSSRSMSTQDRGNLIASFLQVPTRPDSKNVKVVSLKESQSVFFKEVTKLDQKFFHEHEKFFDQTKPVSVDVGSKVYKEAYFLRLKDVLKDVYSGFSFLLDDESLDSLFLDYLKKFPPTGFLVNEVAKHFPNYLRSKDVPCEFGVDRSFVADIAELEWQQVLAFDCEDQEFLTAQHLERVSDEVWPNVKFELHASVFLLSASCNAKDILQQLQNKILPDPPFYEEYFYIVCRENLEVQIHEILKSEMQALLKIKNGEPFYNVALFFAEDEHSLEPNDLSVQKAAAFIVRMASFCVLRRLKGL